MYLERKCPSRFCGWAGLGEASLTLGEGLPSDTPEPKSSAGSGVGLSGWQVTRAVAGSSPVAYRWPLRVSRSFLAAGWVGSESDVPAHRKWLPPVSPGLDPETDSVTSTVFYCSGGHGAQIKEGRPRAPISGGGVSQNSRPASVHH